MTPVEAAMYVANGGVFLGFGAWLGHLWSLMTAAVR